MSSSKGLGQAQAFASCRATSARARQVWLVSLVLALGGRPTRDPHSVWHQSLPLCELTLSLKPPRLAGVMENGVGAHQGRTGPSLSNRDIWEKARDLVLLKAGVGWPLNLCLW